MLVDKKILKNQYKEDYKNVKKIIELKNSAPSEFSANTEHFSNEATLFPYIYHKALVKKHLKNGSKIMDWGAYLGQVTFLLQDDYNVTAYNPSKEPEIKYWHEKFKIKNSKFDKGVKDKKLDFGSEKFDAVISSGVLEHSFEYGISDVDALKNINSNLKDNGLLFIWHLPTKLALSELIAEKKKGWKHILRYDLNDVLVKLSLAGFDVLEIEVNDLIFSKLTKVLNSSDIVDVWELDYKLAHLPVIKKFAHHFSIAAKKIPNFPINPARKGYEVYV